MKVTTLRVIRPLVHSVEAGVQPIQESLIVASLAFSDLHKDWRTLSAHARTEIVDHNLL